MRFLYFALSLLLHATAFASEPMVSAGTDHSMILKADGSAWTLGGNGSGQLGRYSAGSSSPKAEQVMADVKSIDAGWYHSLFVKTDGSAWAVGNNSSGCLGDGTTSEHITPVRILDDVAAVAAGHSHSLYLKTDGTVWACGENDYGGLGDGTTTNRLKPVFVMENVSAIAAGYSFSLFLKTDGTVWASGRNYGGSLGDGTGENRHTPVQVMSDVAAISAGAAHSLFLKTDGTAWAAGESEWGQLGTGDYHFRLSPVQVMSGVKAISAGGGHSFFLTTDDSVWATGHNYFGQLGTGETSGRSSPVKVLTNVRSISAGSNHSLLIKPDGSVWGFGYNQNYQVGSGPERNPNPVRITYEPTALPEIVLNPESRTAHKGESVTFRVGFEGGPVVTWQWKKDNVDIPSATTNPLTLTDVDFQDAASYHCVITGFAGAVESARAVLTIVPDAVPSTIAAGGMHSFALDSKGRAFGWGCNDDGQLGDGTSKMRTTPELVLKGKMRSVSAGLSHTLFLDAYGNVSGTGANTSGQLASRERKHLLPRRISDHATAISAGGAHSLFLLEGDQVLGSGSDTFGQLAYGLPLNPEVREMRHLLYFTQSVAAGACHSVLLTTDGTVLAAGYNARGQLGDGTLIDRSQLIFVMDGVKAIAAGGYHTLFLKTDGSVWATGQNDSGQLGAGYGAKVDHVKTPVRVMTGVKAIAAGLDFSLFVKADGSLWAAGRNDRGQLGTGTTTGTSTPVRVLTGVAEAAAGGYHSIVRKTDGTLWTTGWNKYGQLGDGSRVTRLKFTKIDPLVRPAGAEIDIRQPAGISIQDGISQKNFGTLEVGKKGDTKTFTITNTGNRPLAGLAIRIAGAHAGDFTVTKPDSMVKPGETTTFKVAFKPTKAGTRGAVLRVLSNDKDENPFDIRLSGLGSTR